MHCTKASEVVGLKGIQFHLFWNFILWPFLQNINTSIFHFIKIKSLNVHSLLGCEEDYNTKAHNLFYLGVWFGRDGSSLSAPLALTKSWKVEELSEWHPRWRGQQEQKQEDEKWHWIPGGWEAGNAECDQARSAPWSCQTTCSHNTDPQFLGVLVAFPLAAIGNSLLLCMCTYVWELYTLVAWICLSSWSSGLCLIIFNSYSSPDLLRVCYRNCKDEHGKKKYAWLTGWTRSHDRYWNQVPTKGSSLQARRWDADVCSVAGQINTRACLHCIFSIPAVFSTTALTHPCTCEYYTIPIDPF